MVGRVCRLTRLNIALEISRSNMRLLMSFKGNICEVSWLVWTQLALEDPLCLIVIHHVLFEKNSCPEYFVANVANAFLNSMSVAHVIEQRSLGWTHLRAYVTVIRFSFSLPDSMNVSFVHSIADCRLEVFTAELKVNLMD